MEHLLELLPLQDSRMFVETKFFHIISMYSMAVSYCLHWRY